jgi:hypothetical protein
MASMDASETPCIRFKYRLPRHSLQCEERPSFIFGFGANSVRGKWRLHELHHRGASGNNDSGSRLERRLRIPVDLVMASASPFAVIRNGGGVQALLPFRL